MSDLVETSGGELKIFSCNNGQYVIREEKLLAALGLAPSDDLTDIFRDLFVSFGARRRIGKFGLIDLHALVEQVLPTYLSDFAGNDDDEFVNARAKNILQVLREQLKAYTTMLRTKIIKAIPKVKTEPAGTITISGTSVPVVKDSAGNRWLRYKDFFAVLGFDKPSRRLTDTSLSHYLQDHAGLKKAPVNGHSSIVINLSTLVEDVLPKMLDGQIQLLKIDELRGRIQAVYDDLKKVDMPFVLNKLQDFKIDLQTVLKVVQPKEEEKMLPKEKVAPADLEPLIKNLAAATNVPPVKFAEIIAEQMRVEAEEKIAAFLKKFEE